MFMNSTTYSTFSSPTPGLTITGKKFFITVVLIDLILTTLALFVGDPPEHHFDEGQIMTWVAIGHLFAISYVVWQTFQIRQRTTHPWSIIFSRQFWQPWRESAYFWAVLTVGFFYLACDEMLLLHENIDYLIHLGFGIKETPLTDHLDDLIVMLYGLGGLVVLGHYWRELLRYRSVMPLLAIGIILFLVMVVLDYGTNSETDSFLINYFHINNFTFLWLAGIEDGLKTIIDGILLGVFYNCRELAKCLTD
jgi:hypothetical protein